MTFAKIGQVSKHASVLGNFGNLDLSRDYDSCILICMYPFSVILAQFGILDKILYHFQQKIHQQFRSIRYRTQIFLNKKIYSECQIAILSSSLITKMSFTQQS